MSLRNAPADSLSITHLHVDFSLVHRGNTGPVEAVHNVSLSLHRGELLALIGESGSGKSVILQAIAGLLPDNATWEGTISVAGKPLPLTDRKLMRQQFLGRTIGFVPQNVLAHLTPVRKVGTQLKEALALTHPWSKRRAKARLLCEHVGLEPELLHRYPHELSGGQGQRLGIAMALANNPDFLIADEPTQGLDPFHTNQIMTLFAKLATEETGVLVITHDIPSVEEKADRIGVMFEGHLVEVGPTEHVLTSPAHEVTQALIAALPVNGLQPMGHRPVMPTSETLTYRLVVPEVADDEAGSPGVRAVVVGVAGETAHTSAGRTTGEPEQTDVSVSSSDTADDTPDGPSGPRTSPARAYRAIEITEAERTDWLVLES